MKKYIFLLFIICFKFYGYAGFKSNYSEKLSYYNNQEQILNTVEKEELNFIKFTKQLKTSSTSDYLEKIRTYSKDSLKTLAIKLLSIKELNKKELLQKDISLNPDYYINLLDELKSSEIKSLEYSFLEKELATYSLIKTEKKYTLSVFLNILLGALLLFLFYFIYSIKSTKKLNTEEELSKQEKNIKNHIIAGKSNKEIAEELFISLSTVKTHITNIYHKLNVTNRKELIAKFPK